jgi:hypothetical protein
MAMTEEKQLLQLIRQVAKETFWELLDTQVLPSLQDYIRLQLENSRNDSEHQLESILGLLKGLATTNTNKPSQERAWSWQPEKLSWEKTTGAKGEYEKTQHDNSPDFNELLKDLDVHQGCLERDGWFYWAFKNNTIIGRKRRACNGSH